MKTTGVPTIDRFKMRLNQVKSLHYCFLDKSIRACLETATKYKKYKVNKENTSMLV